MIANFFILYFCLFQLTETNLNQIVLGSILINQNVEPFDQRYSDACQHDLKMDVIFCQAFKKPKFKKGNDVLLLLKMSD